MPLTKPAPHDAHPRQRISVAETEISYVETGNFGGFEIVFLHGNPTSSYLWRNVIPHVGQLGRCYAPDLMGMGDSGPTPNNSYRFIDHSVTLDGWFNVLDLKEVIIVGHDWGGALGFYWAQRNRDRLAGIVYMETIVKPLAWADWPESSRKLFEGFRAPVGEQLVLDKNVFVDRVLPASVLRDLNAEEMRRYRKPYVEPGESRRPTLTWPRRRTGRCSSDRRRLRQVAERGRRRCKAFYQRGSRKYLGRKPARVLSELAESIRGDRAGPPFHSRRRACGDWPGDQKLHRIARLRSPITWFLIIRSSTATNESRL